ncbi:UDP-N-acetylenolpyruvoylglucosamine reductase [Psychromonas sp. CNPT3]|uniref:UDP-N-acetylmuramate dehydrogenase n=1 Tax=Psychromonas sp. CNPT3 TaxID=314282 RepID=UPI00006E890F|nr:UDP-N-acetylmuramate dehydrogenase [Psychromonas sp. CNPT3]AGH82415.1 UDP-N-acetylenolpyruvoylglucosamine reductase [Psychromonas sp. CNPT3]
MIETNCSLKAFNTFSIDATAHILFHLSDLTQLAELSALVKKMRVQNKPILILGAGSNILFCDDFSGLIIKVELLGISIETTENDYILQVGAGENWHDLVTYCIDNDMGGLENLALIPGVVGAAPVQNIGAYGSEFKDFCVALEYLDLDTGKLHKVSNAQCQFAYRDSIFKQANMRSALITQVTLKLAKQWQPKQRNASLSDALDVSAKSIYQSICQVRAEKLPDPSELGNAGSFFKNPVVKKEVADKLRAENPNMPYYPQDAEHVKLAAGWLIEKADLKGRQIGGAAVHKKQALVLINKGNASAQDVIKLAELVRQSIKDKFNIELQHEVRFMDKLGETDLARAIQNV